MFSERLDVASAVGRVQRNVDVALAVGRVQHLERLRRGSGGIVFSPRVMFMSSHLHAFLHTYINGHL